MNPRIARLILHPSLPWLLVLCSIAPPVAFGQEQLTESPEIKVVIEVEEADGSIMNAFVPPAAPAPSAAEVALPNAGAGDPPEQETAAGGDDTGLAVDDAEVSSPKADGDDAVAASEETSEEPVETSETAETKPESAGPPAVNPAVTRNLRVAAELLDEGKYLTIPGPRGSALNAYRMALATDGSSADARAGIQTVLNLLVSKAEQARAHGNVDRARGLLESANGIVEPFVDRSALETLLASIDIEPGVEVAAVADIEEDAQATSEVAENEVATGSESDGAMETADAGSGAGDADSQPSPEPEATVAAAEIDDAPVPAETAEVVDAAIEVAEASSERNEETATDDDEVAKDAPAPADTVVAVLDIPPMYHVGRRLEVGVPDGIEGAVRWMVNENTVAESGDGAGLEYAFAEHDMGTCRVQLYRVAGGADEPVLVAEGLTDVKLFEDNPIEKSVGEPVALDPTRHGPVEGEYGAYEWRVDGEAVASEPTLTWAFERPGSHRIECRMTDPKSEGDRAWPSPVLAWNFDVAASDVVVAATSPDTDPTDAAVAKSEPVPAEMPERQGNPLLIILGAAVIMLAISQAWMAFRLNSLSRSSVQAPPKSNTKPSAPLGSLPPEEDYMQELHQRFRSHETVQE